MKKVLWSIDGRGENVQLNILMRDRFKKATLPAAPITWVPGENNTDKATLFRGDIKEVRETLEALAQIAWENGWRPQGLTAALANTVGNFKEPKTQ